MLICNTFPHRANSKKSDLELSSLLGFSLTFTTDLVESKCYGPETKTVIVELYCHQELGHCYLSLRICIFGTNVPTRANMNK